MINKQWRGPHLALLGGDDGEIIITLGGDDGEGGIWVLTVLQVIRTLFILGVIFI